jgi:uncharacterized protein YxeA
MYTHLIYLIIITGLLYWNFIIQDNVSPYLKNKKQEMMSDDEDEDDDLLLILCCAT